MRKYFILFVLLIVVSTAYPQAVMEFVTTSHDFGNIKETDGPVSYDFVFKNTGNAPIILKNVESSCGCTSPQWTKQPVLPGKTGFVKATFDPKDRPSYFDKTITVTSNAKNSVAELKIKGNVEPKNRTVLDDYPYEQPSGIRLPFDHLSLISAVKGDLKQVEIKFYNNSGKDVKILFPKLPDYLKITVEPEPVKSKSVGVFNIEYNTVLKGEYGLNTEIVEMSVNGKLYPVRLSIFIEEDFNGIKMSTAPVIEVAKKYYNFGTVKRGQQAGFTYEITNSGKSTLKIHRVYSTDENIGTQLSKNELGEGETAYLKVFTNGNIPAGKISAIISIISNSPINSELKLRFYGEIQ
ncbi:MAG: DUF1573 domain-containing protein [Culturomica sp.]|nr:DUF1573 domain-containing protein [Culturomica sp.]